jgi:hypothetical protein
MMSTLMICPQHGKQKVIRILLNFESEKFTFKPFMIPPPPPDLILNITRFTHISLLFT